MSSLLPFQKITRTYRHFARLRKILSVLFRNGFGFLFDKLRGLVPEAAHAGNWDELVNSPISLPERLRNVMVELGPTFVKLGQILSGRPDLIPLAYIREFTKLQDRVPPFPYQKVREIIKKEFGGEIEEFFAEFDEEAIAAASIAQGHRGRLKDGSEVFVKIRRPDIEGSIRADLEILTLLADFMEKHNEELRFLQPGKIVREFAHKLEEELNLDFELANIQRFSRQFEGRQGLVVPRTWPKLSSVRVLTIEFIRGCKGTDLEGLQRLGIDRQKVSRLGADLLLEQFFVHGFFHADPHPGNLFFLPGNRICYVDFGQIGRCSMEERDTFAGLLAAIFKGNEKKSAKLLLRLAEFVQEPDMEALERDLSAFTDHYFYREIDDLSTADILQEFYDLCNRHQLGLKPHIYLMLKAMGESDELGRTLDPEFRIVTQLRPFLVKSMLRSLNPSTKAAQFSEIIEEMFDFLKVLPKQQKTFWQQCLEGRLLVNYRLQGLERLQNFINHGLNRLCLALIQVGLLIASGLIIHAGRPPLLGGIPVIGLLGILCFITLFSLMLWDMLRLR
ncbi:MAG: AarF/UbiB family protein [Lentisphaeria bacterium]